jgi:acetyltransferase-like isoleucine patch superfamily enzyme
MSLRARLGSMLPGAWQARARDMLAWADTMRARRAAGFHRRRNLGAGSLVDRDAHVLGWSSVRIGRKVVIAAGSILNVNHRDGQPRIVIGDYSFVGRGSFFSSGDRIEIGAYAMLSPGGRFLGAHHHYDDPMRPYITTGVSQGGTIRLGVNCMTGADVTILGPVSVGHGCVIGAGALVTHDVPRFSLVIGRPARIIKRYDMGSRNWIAVEDFTPDMETMLPDEATYLALLQAACPSIAMPYAAAGPARGDLA